MKKITIKHWCKTPGQSFPVKVVLCCRQPNYNHLNLDLEGDDVPWEIPFWTIKPEFTVDRDSCFFGIGAELVCFEAFLIEARKRYAPGVIYWDGKSFTGRICSLFSSRGEQFSKKQLELIKPRILGQLWAIRGPFVVSLDSIPF